MADGMVLETESWIRKVVAEVEVEVEVEAIVKVRRDYFDRTLL